MTKKNKITSKNNSEEKKVGKYLKYAIGEIAIVIIGILFVLIANFIREQVQENESKQNALIALKNDITRDSNGLNSYWIPRLEKQEEARNRLNLFLKNSTTIIDSMEFVTDVILVSTYFTFNQNKAAVEDLLYGGRLHLIEDDSLRIALLKYKYRVEKVAEFDLIHREYFLEIQGRIGPKILGGMALPEGFIAYHANDTINTKIIVSHALDWENLISSDNLRTLLAATGVPFAIKKNSYISIEEQAELLLKLLNIAIDEK